MHRYTIHTYTFIWLFFYIYAHWFIMYSSVFFHSFIALNIHINGVHYNCLLLKVLLLFCCLWRFYISGNFLISTFNYKFDDPECLSIYSTTPMETARSLDLLCAMGLWISVFCICYWMNDYYCIEDNDSQNIWYYIVTWFSNIHSFTLAAEKDEIVWHVVQRSNWHQTTG